MKANSPKAVSELIAALTLVTDTEGHAKIYHSLRVAVVSARLTASYKLPARKRQDIFYAAMLHDIGGVGYPMHIVHYLKRKDKISRKILLSHPILGAELVSGIPRMEDAAKLILDHHEWIDGSGYPRGIKKNRIPLGSQLIRIADSIDILAQGKAKGKTLAELAKILAKNIEKEFSQEVFARAIACLKKNNLFRKLQNTERTEEIFAATRKRQGDLSIPAKIDAIGKTLEVLAQIIDMKHPYTAGHSQRVSRCALAIALAMDLPHDDITRLKWAGLIHDIGKLNISRRILDKPTALTPKEYRAVKKHAHLTQIIMRGMSVLKEISPVAASHHESYDGSGYPQGLKGDRIPLGARILAVCDAFDAMTSNRPYRNPLTPEEACKELQRKSGSQFDPRIVKEAVPLFENMGM